mmetsp:Transcript_4163/g.11237  ORF Transcript_4163/g.11237 Transcript_4163/m.11237 type:complete len:118 (-) Transcript_4163:1832-2185(-)|eukprot:1143634-Pelagomonas_calceolata.AAC.4
MLVSESLQLPMSELPPSLLEEVSKDDSWGTWRKLASGVPQGVPEVARCKLPQSDRSANEGHSEWPVLLVRVHSVLNDTCAFDIARRSCWMGSGVRGAVMWVAELPTLPGVLGRWKLP